MNILTQPWPWYVSGPLIGLMVPTLLILGNKAFGISSSLRHICAACIPMNISFFKYNWKSESWNLIFALGILLGGLVAGYFFQNPNPIKISENTIIDLNNIGITDHTGFVPQQIFNFNSLFTLRGFILMVVGGFFVGFGTRYANGCTSGHAIMGLSNLQWPSLVSTICFFVGGLIMTWFILPLIMHL
ncbi:MAG: YeeE/YedE thiosulfate transporter family protein [Bacteroidia bacterium]